MKRKLLCRGILEYRQPKPAPLALWAFVIFVAAVIILAAVAHL